MSPGETKKTGDTVVDDLGRTAPVVRDYRNANSHCLDRHVAECLDPFGCHQQGSAGAQLRLQVVGWQKPLIIEGRPWVVGLDPMPILLVLEFPPDEHTLACSRGQLSNIFQALLRRNPTDEAEWSVVSDSQLNVVALNHNSIADDPEDTGFWKCHSLSSAVDCQTTGAQPLDLRDHVVHRIAQRAHRHNVEHWDVKELRQVKRQPVVGKVDDHVSLVLQTPDV